MPSDLSRRNLLGLMAAAPVAAVAKPAMAVPKATLHVRSDLFDRDAIRELAQSLNSHIDELTMMAKGERLDIWTPNEDRPPCSRAADDRRPGAPAKASGGSRPAEASGAPAPDEENIILKHARAC